MSYDITNYAFKGVPLNQFVDNLSQHPAGSRVQLTIGDQIKTFLLVEKNLILSLQETQKSAEYESCKDQIDVSQIAAELPKECNRYSQGGPKSLLIRTILRACGIALSDIFAAENERDPNRKVELARNFALHNIKGFPLVEMNGETLPMGLIEIPDELQGFVYIASQRENWELIREPKQDTQTYERSEPVLSFDLEKNIKWAQNSTASDSYDMWREDFCAELVNMFIKPGEEFIDEDECWTSNIGVTSTRHGDVHNSGGMTANEMYLMVSGADIESFDDEGWNDPETETPTAYRKLKELLFGNPDYPTEKYTPQFGG